MVFDKFGGFTQVEDHLRHYNDAKVIIYVYDKDKSNSLRNAEKCLESVKEIRQNNPTPAIKILVRNDRDQYDVIDEEEKKLSKKLKYKILSVNLIENRNVNSVWSTIMVRLINKVKFGISDTEKGILSKKMSIIFKNFLNANINTTNNRTSSFLTINKINESPQINTIKIPSRSKKELFLEKISQISNDKRNKY